MLRRIPRLLRISVVVAVLLAVSASVYQTWMYGNAGLATTQTAFGPLVGAAIFSLLPEVLRGSEQWRFVIFAVLIMVLVFRPTGLLGDRSAVQGGGQ